jgi:hypothetical protein
MKKNLAFILAAMLLVTVAAAGCSRSEGSGNPDITGLIFAIEGDRILIVAGIEDVDTDYEDWFEAGNRAIYFAVTDKTVIEAGGEKGSFDILRLGQKVEAWADGPLAESYPEQGAAKRIVILE